MNYNWRFPENADYCGRFFFKSSELLETCKTGNLLPPQSLVVSVGVILWGSGAMRNAVI